MLVQPFLNALPKREDWTTPLTFQMIWATILKSFLFNVFQARQSQHQSIKVKRVKHLYQKVSSTYLLNPPSGFSLVQGTIGPSSVDPGVLRR